VEPELRKTVCRLVAGLVVSDDDLSAEEDALIDRLVARFEIEDRAEIFPIVDRTEAAATVATLPEEVREQAFRLLVLAALADGKVVDEERSYLRTVGTAMGLSEAAVDARIAAGR
jgi:DnaJ-domain-containing protein 1